MTTATWAASFSGTTRRITIYAPRRRERERRAASCLVLIALKDWRLGASGVRTQARGTQSDLYRLAKCTRKEPSRPHPLGMEANVDKARQSGAA